MSNIINTDECTNLCKNENKTVIVRENITQRKINTMWYYVNCVQSCAVVCAFTATVTNRQYQSSSPHKLITGPSSRSCRRRCHADKCSATNFSIADISTEWISSKCADMAFSRWPADAFWTSAAVDHRAWWRVEIRMEECSCEHS